LVVQLQVPDDIAEKLLIKWGDLPRCALEALAVDAYREDVLTAYEVQRLLGFSSRWKTEEFLKRAGADLGYTEDDLRADSETLQGLSDRAKPYRFEPASLGGVEPGINLDKTLQLSDALEDEA